MLERGGHGGNSFIDLVNAVFLVSSVRLLSGSEVVRHHDCRSVEIGVNVKYNIFLSEPKRGISYRK